MATEDTFVSKGIEYKIVRKRWLILLIATASSFLGSLKLSYFGFINDIASKYFRTPPKVTDLLSTISLMSRAVSSAGIVLTSEKLSLRSLTIGAFAGQVAGAFLSVTGVSSRKNFPIVVIGQSLDGMAMALSLIISMAAPSNWFPQKERGKAVSIPWVCRRVALAFSSITASTTIIVGLQRNSDLMDRFRSSCMIVFGFFGLFGCLMYVLSIIWVTDHPPVVDPRESSESADVPWRLINELTGLRQLLRNKTFLMLLLHQMLMYMTTQPMSHVLLSSVILKSHPGLNDLTISAVYCVGHICGSVTAIAAGFVVDNYRRKEWIYFGSVSFVTVSCVAFAVTLHDRSVFGLFIGFFLYNGSRDFSVVCLSHALVDCVQNESDANKIKAFTIFVPGVCLFSPLYTYAIRVTLTFVGAPAAALFPCPFLLISAVLAVLPRVPFAKDNYQTLPQDNS